MWIKHTSHKIALFDVAHWNVFGTVNETTNMCEGFHSALNEAASVSHPSVYYLKHSSIVQVQRRRLQA